MVLCLLAQLLESDSISMWELRFEFYSRWDWARSVQDLVVKPEAMSVWSLIKRTPLVLLKWTFKCYRSVMCRTWRINAIWSLKSDSEQHFDLFHIELQQSKSRSRAQRQIRVGVKVQISKKTKCVGFSTVGEALNGDQAKVLCVCKNEKSVIIYSPFMSF